MSEFKELELEIDNLGDEAAEELVRSVLNKMNGVITPGEITHAVRQAGFTIDYKQPG